MTSTPNPTHLHFMAARDRLPRLEFYCVAAIVFSYAVVLGIYMAPRQIYGVDTDLRSCACHLNSNVFLVPSLA